MKDREDQAQHLTFFVAGDEYALGILQVREIIEYGTVTKVPTAPGFVRGVINLRGSVVPVIDLAVKLGLPASSPSKWSCIIIIELDSGGESLVLGLLVDTMGQVMQLLPQDIEKPPLFGTRARIDCLLGMGKTEGKFVMILDLNQVIGRELSSRPPPLWPIPSGEQEPETRDVLPGQ